MFNVDSPLPSDIIIDFLKNMENKSDLNLFLAIESQKKTWNTNTYITHHTTVINCLDGSECRMYNDDGLTLEEADNLIVCHLWHMINEGFKDIVVRTVDSDVIVFLCHNLSLHTAA